MTSHQWRRHQHHTVNTMASSSERFGNFEEAEIQKLLEDKDSQNTKRSTKVCRGIFEDYLKEKNANFPQNSEELAAILKKFYVEVRKTDGALYTKSSLCSIRFGLKRYFKALQNIDIIKDKEFDEANSVYQAQCTALKKNGRAKTEHKPPITDEDIKKLYKSGVFSTDSPTTLQNKVFFEVMFYFCRRGRQNLRELKKDDFTINVNTNGRRCVIKTKDELTKNHRVNDAQAEEGGMMIANDSHYCPVYSFEKYLSHLNPINEFLFQRPKSKVPSDSAIWYDNMVVGVNTLGGKMKILSKEANLSVEYTNHSIRATTITILDRNGYEARHIMSVSGHRNESSIKSYSKTDQTTKTKMASCLMSVIEPVKENVANTSIVDTQVSSECFPTPLLTDSQEERILQDFNFQSTTHTSKVFNFYNCKVDIYN